MIRTANGRPLRFFAMLLAGWMMLRLFGPGIMTPAQLPPSSIAIALPSSLASLATPLILATSAMATQRASSPFAFEAQWENHSRSTPGSDVLPTPYRKEDMPVDLMNFITFTTAFANRHYASDPGYISGLHGPTASPAPLLIMEPTADRWRAGAWLLWRNGGAEGNKGVPAGQLGGSQAGVRLDYDIAPHAKIRMTAYSRLTSALQSPTAPETAVGLSIQPLRAVPITLAAERRIALGVGARNANAVMAVGGFGPKLLAPSIMAEAYVQTGIVGFRQRDAFIDGKFSLTAPLAGTPLRLGAALSGGAQPGLNRLDIGPELQVRLPLPQSNARLSVEWRERIAGQARPGSGLAITLAADF